MSIRSFNRQQQQEFEEEDVPEEDYIEQRSVPVVNIFKPGEEEAAVEFDAILASLRRGKLSTAPSSSSAQPPKKRARPSVV